jgi:PIN domain nuclease of toxin-antitoxin system
MIILDTQVWLWWLHDPSRLSRKARTAIEKAERSDGYMVSTISVWEIAIKNQLGKLNLPLDIDEWFRRASTYPNLVIEPLLPSDAIESTRLPGYFHKDPADRIVIALARRHGVSLVTSDSLIRSYRYVTTI